MSNNLASFAPYAPPPDERLPGTSSQRAPVRPWFPAHQSSQHEPSYQSGGIPTFMNATAGGSAALDQAETAQNQWETRYGARVDLLAASAYLLGPISALLLLIIETANDFVRFHAYQSALLTSPLVLLRIFASLAHFPGVLRTLLTLTLLILQIYMAAKAYLDAINTGLSRYQLPYIGEIAERWLQEE